MGKLEVRMGPGGNGYHNGVGRPQPRPQSQPQHLPQSQTNRGKDAPNMPSGSGSRPVPGVKNNPDPYGEPALHFGGNQQFFFRFIVQVDNNRFSRCLEDAIAYEIEGLCGELSSGGSGRGGVSGSNSGSGSTNRSGGGSGSGGGSSGTDSRNGVKNGMLSSHNTTSSSPPSSSFLKNSNQDMDSEGLGLGLEQTEGTYALSVQSFALRTVKLRILGKFLGLLTFWPQWSLTLSRGSNGPLSILAANVARTRGALRPSTNYPMKNILEQSWLNSRLSYTVPWVIEFLKMIVWDRTYLHENNPYRDVFGLLCGIQKNDVLHPLKRNFSGNRLYVLIEIQNLWSTVPLSDIRITPLPIIKNKNLNSNENSKIDEQNSAFSPSFLHHITPFLNETIKIFHKRHQLNLTKRIPSNYANIGLQINSKNSNTNNSANIRTNIFTNITNIVQTATKRQTPNLIGLLQNLEIQDPQITTLTSPKIKKINENNIFNFSSPQNCHSAGQSVGQSVGMKMDGSERERESERDRDRERDRNEGILGVDSLGLVTGSKGIKGTSLMAQFSAAAAVTTTTPSASSSASTSASAITSTNTSVPASIFATTTTSTAATAVVAVKKQRSTSITSTPLSTHRSVQSVLSVPTPPTTGSGASTPLNTHNTPHNTQRLTQSQTQTQTLTQSLTQTPPHKGNTQPITPGTGVSTSTGDESTLADRYKYSII